MEIITHIKCRANPDEALIAATLLPTPSSEIIRSDLVFFVLIGKNGVRDQFKRVKKWQEDQKIKRSKKSCSDWR